LRDLLRQLRQSRALQIAVEARYITISRNWLEQIGVDLDVILNNGNAGFDRTTILNPATGNPVLVPREFTRLGFTPGAPGGVGITQPTQPFGHVFGQPGLVPGTGSVGPASGTLTPIPIVNNTLDLASPQNTNIAGSLGGLANTSPAFQIFGSFLDNIQVDFLLRATQIDRRSSDLDAPRLVLFNGQRATFESFIEQDYIAALTPVIGDNAGAFLPQVATALTGRSLDVQATVSADRRYVTMTVRTFTRVTGDFRTVFFGGSQTVGSGFIELATQTTQQIRTTVSVPDGGTLLIGGLKLSAERDVDAGVPVLSRIPILKRAFSNTSNVKDDQVLLILIKPTIIIQEEAEAEAFPTLSSSAP
jgi:general secretion pathway protein D